MLSFFQNSYNRKTEECKISDSFTFFFQTVNLTVMGGWLVFEMENKLHINVQFLLTFKLLK